MMCYFIFGPTGYNDARHEITTDLVSAAIIPAMKFCLSSTGSRPNSTSRIRLSWTVRSEPLSAEAGALCGRPSEIWIFL